MKPVEPVTAPLVPETVSVSKGGLPPQIWLVGLIAIVLILLTVFSIVL